MRLRNCGPATSRTCLRRVYQCARQIMEQGADTSERFSKTSVLIEGDL